VNQGLLKRLEEIEGRQKELERLLADPATQKNPRLYAKYAREHGSLGKISEKFGELRRAFEQMEDAQAIVDDEKSDEELISLAKEELETAREKVERLEREILELLVTKDEDTDRDVIMEIRAGTGGEEAALFAADLFRMYIKYAESKGWKYEVMHSRATGLGGFKEICFGIQGDGAYERLRFESGIHRVQRVPVTEASGRIHTSAVTVAVLPEVEEVEVNINPDDLEIDTFRASGPGGQHVNKTSSAVRITHKPTGIVVTCQDEKSQHKNRARAMRILRARIYEKISSERQREIDSLRRSQVKSGDRSEKIRTYNFPDNRVTDHRIGLTVHDLRNVLLGKLDVIIDALIAHEREEKLKELTKRVQEGAHLLHT